MRKKPHQCGKLRIRPNVSRAESRQSSADRLERGVVPNADARDVCGSRLASATACSYDPCPAIDLSQLVPEAC